MNEVVYLAFLGALALLNWAAALGGFCLLLMAVIIGLAFWKWLRNNRYISYRVTLLQGWQCRSGPTRGKMTGEAGQRCRRGLLRPGFCCRNHFLLSEHLWRLHHSPVDALDSARHLWTLEPNLSTLGRCVVRRSASG